MPRPTTNLVKPYPVYRHKIWCYAADYTLMNRFDGWFNLHSSEVQALSALVIVFLTIGLMVLNVIYVRANWKMMKLMEMDVLTRIRPFPFVKIERVEFVNKFSVRFDSVRATIICSNSSIRLNKLRLFILGDTEAVEVYKRHTVVNCEFNQAILPVSQSHIVEYPLNGLIWQSWYGYFEFMDIAAVRRYVTYFDSGGNLTYSEYDKYSESAFEHQIKNMS